MFKFLRDFFFEFLASKQAASKQASKPASRKQAASKQASKPASRKQAASKRASEQAQEPAS